MELATGATPSPKPKSAASPTRKTPKRTNGKGSPTRSPQKLRSPPRSPDFTRRAPVSPGMSPSSLARSQSHRLSPSQRQAADEARYRERVRKYREHVRPGPGQYTPQVDEKGLEADMSVRKGAETMQNAVFVSKTKRPGPGQASASTWSFNEHMGDPGAYTPGPQDKIAYGADNDRSPSKLTQEGNGFFGSKSERTLTIPADLNGESQPTRGAGIKETSNSVNTGLQETPGPAAYTPQLTELGKEADMSVMQGAETMPMAVFQSKTARIGDILPKATAGNPGPGAYDPKESLVINHLPGANPGSNLVSKVGRDTRFAGDTIDDVGMMTGPDVGPGQYDPMRTIDGELNTVAARVAERSQNNEDAAFVSNQDRNIYEWMLAEMGNFGNGWWKG